MSGVAGAASLACNATGGCIMKIEGLPVADIEATCTAAECLASGAAAAPGRCVLLLVLALVWPAAYLTLAVLATWWASASQSYSP